MDTPNKIKNFMWSVCQNALASKENLYKRKMVTNPLCSICQTQAETLEHLFLLCGWTSKIWQHPRLNIHFSANQVFRMDKWLIQFMGTEPNLPRLEKISVILWELWKSQNGAVFRHRPPNPQNVVVAAEYLLQNHKKWSINKRKKLRTRKSEEEQWVAPDVNEIKVNIDGAYKPGSFTASVAAVCRNHEGILVDGFIRDVCAASAEQAETMALLSALEFLSSQQIENLIVESDCLNLVECLASEGRSGVVQTVSWESQALIDQAQGLMTQFVNLKLVHCKRSCNRVVDWVLKAHLAASLSQNWVMKPPRDLLDLLCLDSTQAGFR